MLLLQHLNFVGSVIKRPTDSTTSTTSEQTDNTSGQTDTTSGQADTTSGQTSTTDGKASTMSGQTSTTIFHTGCFFMKNPNYYELELSILRRCQQEFNQPVGQLLGF